MDGQRKERQSSNQQEEHESEESNTEKEKTEIKESVVESPEQKKEREYRENTAQLLERAEQYLEEKRKEVLSAEMLEATSITANPVPLPTLANARAERGREKNHSTSGVLQNLKERIKRVQLGRTGIENLDDLMALTYYMEQNLIDREHHFIHVKTSRQNREIKKYERRGYEVHDIHNSYREGEVEFTIEKETPYRMSSKEEKKLVELLGKANDPVVMIERLKRVGFSINGHTMHHQFEALRDFVESPEINEMLEKLERAGLKSNHLYFGYGDDTSRRLGHAGDYVAEWIKEYAFDPHRREEMNDKNLQRVAQLKQMGFEISFGDHWDEVIKMVSDDDTFTMLAFMRAREQLRGYPNDQWNSVMLLRDAGLAGEFAGIIRTSPWLALELLHELPRGAYDYPSSTTEVRKEKKIENANALLALPIVQEMRADPGLAEFVEQAATLRGSVPSLQNAEINKSLREYPEALPFLEICRELQIPPEISGLQEVLKNQKILEDVFQPEFREFATRMKDGLGYQVKLEDFLRYDFYTTTDEIRAPAGGQILGLFHNQNWREGMASGRASELIKKFGDFQMRQAHFYTELLKIPNSLEMIAELEQKFQLDFPVTLRGGYGDYRIAFDTFEFRQFCGNERVQKELFDERTIAFHQRLKNDFGYKFNFSDRRSLFELSQDAELTELLADPENQELIKEAFASPQELTRIARIKEVDERFKPLIRILAKEFQLFYGNYDADEKLVELYEAQGVVLPIAHKLKELKIDFNIIRDASQLNTAADHNLPDLFEKMKDQPALCSFIFHNSATLVKDDSDVRFIATIMGKHGKAGDALIRDYMKCLQEGAITVANKGDVEEFSDNFRILSPAIITEYIKAKQSGTKEIFLTHLKSVAEKLTGSGLVSSEERSRVYYQDLLREVYQNNSGNWTTYANNESCEDRSADLAPFRIRPRYEIDLLSASEIKVKEGEELDRQAIEVLKKEILSVAEKMQNMDYDSERAKETINEEVNAVFQDVAKKGGFAGIDLEHITSPEEKLFLIMTDTSYGTRAMKQEDLRSLLIFYEFAYFEDIRDYMQGTSDRVSRATNQDYALLCELNTFFSDRIKEINRRLVEAGFSNEAIKTTMPEYFKKLSRETLEQEHAATINRLQIDKLGLTEDFVKQIVRALRGKTGKTYTLEQTQRLIKHYESLTKGLPERVSSSPKQRTKAVYGQLKSQREKTLQAIKTLTGRELLPNEVYLGQLNIQEFLESEVNISEGIYDENQFASYTIQKFMNFFGEERDITDRELNKFQSSQGTQREILFGYISKNKESAYARMVGGVCVSGDNPQKVGQECMWNMPNYFQVVLQDPETYRCVGVVLLHHFIDQEGKKILTASLNPSSTYLYGTDEKALCKGLIDTLEIFAKENDFDMILFPENKQIRTNRTGGIFEREIDTLITGINRKYTFSEPKRFSYSPNYFMDKMDVIWTR